MNSRSTAMTSYLRNAGHLASDSGSPADTDGSQHIKQTDFDLHGWQWPTSEAAPSYSHHGHFPESSVILSSSGLHMEALPPLPAASQLKDLPVLDGHHDYLERQRFPCSPSSSSALLSPLSLGHGLESDQVHKVHHSSGAEHSLMIHPPNEPLLLDDDESLSPLDWRSRRGSILASPFSEDSDSDDGLAPSPFSSPESTSEPEEEEEGADPPLYFSPTSPLPESRYHLIDEYPHLDLYHDSGDSDDALPPLSFSSSPLSHPPLAASLPLLQLNPLDDEQQLEQDHLERPDSLLSSANVTDLGLQSPSLSSTPLPLFDTHYTYHSDYPMDIPDSPRRRSSDLPSLENDLDFSSSPFGLGLHSSTSMSTLSLDFQQDFDHLPPPGVSQRTTWLSLPGADTDDDLIPAELASKNYIPDPSLAIPTTPSQNLLLWDPTTRSGLPANLPVFDGTSRHSRRLDSGDLPLVRPSSPDENFVVDAKMIAELAKKDVEKSEEVQKVCELRQRTTMAAAVAAAMAANRSSNRDGAQWEAERVKERWRELTALLRLKLRLDEKKTNSNVNEGGLSNEMVNDGDKLSEPSPSLPLSSDSSLPSSSSLIGSAATESTTATSTCTTSLPTLGSSSTPGLDISASLSTPLPSSSATSSASQPSQRRSSKPKITSMAQLVANMVFQRQQEALRRSPARNRTWPLPSSGSQTSAPGGKNKIQSHASPRSPLRQMILPEDVASDDADEESRGSPLQLSPLCFGLCSSPEDLCSQLEVLPTLG